MTKGIPEVQRGADPTTFVGHVVRIQPSMVKRLPNQPRTHFSARALVSLRDSISEIGQQQPATVIPWQDGTFRIRDGERRWRCCVELKRPLLALVVDAKSEEEEFELSTAANMNRESHSPLEKALAMKRLRDGALQRTPDEIARTFGVTRTTVDSHLLVVDQLPKEVIDLMDPNAQGGRPRTLQISAAVRLTSLKDYPDAQITIARRIVNENLSIAAASRLVDQFADSKQINSGRGRERRPSDHLDLLRSALHSLHQRTSFFSRRDQTQTNELVAFLTVERYDELADQLRASLDELTSIARKFNKAGENLQARRKAVA